MGIDAIVHVATSIPSSNEDPNGMNVSAMHPIFETLIEPQRKLTRDDSLWFGSGTGHAHQRTEIRVSNCVYIHKRRMHHLSITFQGQDEEVCFHLNYWDGMDCPAGCEDVQ